MTVAILGSRIYRPLADVDAAIAELHPDAIVVGVGESPVAKRARESATARSLSTAYVPLEADRGSLLKLADDGADIVVFVCRDPDTKQPTSGVAGIQFLLTEKGIPFRQIDSALPGRVCRLLTDLDVAVEKALQASQQPRRQLVLNQQALGIAARIADERDAYRRKLDEAFGYGVGDPELDAKFARFLKTYQACCDGLEGAKRILTPPAEQRRVA